MLKSLEITETSNEFLSFYYMERNLNICPFHFISYLLMQARSCLYASTQLNPHYFDKIFFFLVKNESKAIHLHFYAKINVFSLVKKALRRPQNAPNCTIYFKIFRGGACPLNPQIVLNPHSLQASYAPVLMYYIHMILELNFIK